MFASPGTHPPNECYCMDVPPPLNGTCDFEGVTRMFSCKSGTFFFVVHNICITKNEILKSVHTLSLGAPAVISKPHFLDGDAAIVNSVVGLKPDRELHDTLIDIEPVADN